MKQILTRDEIAFLLRGGAMSQAIPEEKHSFKLLEAISGLFPRKRVALALILLCISVIPLLGGRVFRDAFGENVFLELWILTALAGGFLIMRNAGPGLEALVTALRAGTSPGHSVLQRLVRALAGLMLIMPGPVVNILACVMLLPPISRMIAILFRRKLDGYLERQEN